MIELGGRERPEAVWRVRADKWRAVDVEDAREFMPLHDARLVEPDAQVLSGKVFSFCSARSVLCVPGAMKFILNSLGSH